MVLYVATYSNTHIVPILDVWPHIDSVFYVWHTCCLYVWRSQFEVKCATKSTNVCLFSYLGTHVISMCGGHSLRLYVPQKVSMCVGFPKCGTHVVLMCGDQSLRLYVPQIWFTMCGLMLFLCVATIS